MSWTFYLRYALWLLFTGVSYQVIWWCTHTVKLQVALKSCPAFVCTVTYLVIHMKSCFFHRCPVMTEFVKIFTVQVTSSCSLSWPYYMALVLRGLLYSSLATSGAYATFRLTISPNVEAVTCQRHCTTHSPDWSSPWSNVLMVIWLISSLVTCSDA